MFIGRSYFRCQRYLRIDFYWQVILDIRNLIRLYLLLHLQLLLLLVIVIDMGISTLK